MDTVEAAIFVAAVIWLVTVPVVLQRVKREYEGGGVITDSTVRAVWLSYGLLAASVIAAAAVGTWQLGMSATVSLALGLPLIVIGVLIDVAGVVSMGSLARMNGQDPDRLITGGAFRYSRNPQNVGIGIAGIGVALLGDSGLALALVVVSIAVFRAYLIYEEAHLERVFGEEFQRYRAGTSRFLGLPGGEASTG